MALAPGAYAAAARHFTPAADRPWHRQARPDQRPPAGDWWTWLITGGRGSGKTRTGAETLVDWIETDPGGEWAIIAPTYADTRDTCVEGPSGLLAALGTTRGEAQAGRATKVAGYNRSLGEIHLRNGATVRMGSADDGALRVQGKNLKGAWCDEIGLWARWDVAWDESITFAVREGQARIVATGTPKVSRPAVRLLRRLIGDPRVVHTRLRTVDNLTNLAASFAANVVARAKGTRLERQELEGELLDDITGALWSRETIEACRVPELPTNHARLKHVAVGVDPADGAAEGDEQAWTVAGVGWDHHLYVVKSSGMHADPLTFLRAVVDDAVEFGAQIVVEKNHGGAYLTAALEQVLVEKDVMVPYRTVTASDSKRTRAEPVAGLYAQGRVHHVGDPMVELEDQMCSYTGGAKEKSPDRLDSLVWAIWPFLGWRDPADGAESAFAWAENVTSAEPEGVFAWS